EATAAWQRLDPGLDLVARRDFVEFARYEELGAVEVAQPRPDAEHWRADRHDGADPWIMGGIGQGHIRAKGMSDERGLVGLDAGLGQQKLDGTCDIERL